MIERDPKRARRISEQLLNTIVLNGDAADEELLIEENIDSCDVFAALTNSEEANILSAMLAKRLGARKVMALINKPSYADLMESGSIDIAISPQTITIGSLLAHVRRGDVVRVHSLRRGAAEALEAVVHGTDKTSRVIGRRVGEIPLPEGAIIGAVVRGEEVHIAHHDTHDRQRRSRHRVPVRPPARRTGRTPVLGPGRALSFAELVVLAVAHVLGLMMAFFGLLYLLPIAWSLAVQDGAVIDFVAAALINAFAGLGLAAATRRYRRELKPRDGFLLVSLSWALMSASAAVPFMIAMPDLTFTDAYFEAVSGLTTTGSTVLNDLDDLPQSINLWRHTLHWIGGIGIIVLAVAVLPLLGVGGMQLYKAETPGPVKDEKLTPRITETAKALWFTYLAITIVGRRRAAHRRHELVRRHLPRLLGHRARRILDS